MGRGADGDDVMAPTARRHVFTPGDFVIVGAAFFTLAFFAVMAVLIVYLRCSDGAHRRRRQQQHTSPRNGPIIPTHMRPPSPLPSLPTSHTVERGVLTERLATAPVVSSYFRRLWQRWRAMRGKDNRDNHSDGDDEAVRQEEGRAFDVVDDDIDGGGVFYVRNGEMRTMRQRPARTSPSEYRDSAHALRAGTFDREWQRDAATSFGRHSRGLAGGDDDDLIPAGAQSDSAAVMRSTRRIIHRGPGAPRAHVVPSPPSPVYHATQRRFVQDNPGSIYATPRGDAYDDDDDDDEDEFDEEEEEEETEGEGGDYSQGEDSDQGYRYAPIDHSEMPTTTIHDPEAHQRYVLMQQEQRRTQEGGHKQTTVY